MRITADTNFFISATQWDYSISHKLLIKLIRKNVKIFTTKEILNEFSAVLIRDFKYNEKEINGVMTSILSVVEITEPIEKVDIIKEDPDDNKVLECALVSNSKYVITYDNHLLKLKDFQGIKIITPNELLKFL